MAAEEGHAMQVDGSERPERPELPGFSLQPGRFVIRTREFERQYAQMYYGRLSALKTRLAPAGKERWPHAPLVRLMDARSGQDCQIVATLFKQGDKKPDFLKEYTALEDGEIPPEAPASRVDPDDYLVAEDESGVRVKLVGDVPNVGKICTGVVVLLVGRLLDSTSGKLGEFRATDCIFPGLGPQSAITPIAPSPGAARYIAVVSGLGFGSSDKPMMLARQALAAFLKGHPHPTELGTKEIGRLLIAGNLIQPTEDLKLCDKIKLDSADLKCIQDAPVVSPMKQADEWLAFVAQTIPVDVLPGPNDPSNVYTPHQALHPCMLPAAYEAKASFVPSPHEFRVNGMTGLVTSGDGVADICRYTTNTPAEALRLCAEAAHLTPTAPDTLPCYPFTEDPLVMPEGPHLLIAGNQPEFSTELMEGAEGRKCRLVNIPSFTQVPSFVLIDLMSPTLETMLKPISVRAP